MRMITLLVALLIPALIPAMIFAQDGSGHYATHNGHQMTDEMPDGTMVQTSHYTQITYANNPSFPLHNMSGDCMGRFHVAADGKPLSGSGTCVTMDGNGNTANFWWRMDKAMTSDCADICGSWGYFHGTGKFKGIEGGGTWTRTTIFPNGTSGTWTGKIKTM